MTVESVAFARLKAVLDPEIFSRPLFDCLRVQTFCSRRLFIVCTTFPLFAKVTTLTPSLAAPVFSRVSFDHRPYVIFNHCNHFLNFHSIATDKRSAILNLRAENFRYAMTSY